MTPLDFLYYTIAISIWILMGMIVILTFSLVRMMEHVRTITKTAYETALSMRLIKEGMRFSLFNLIEKSLNIFGKRGVTNE